MAGRQGPVVILRPDPDLCARLDVRVSHADGPLEAVFASSRFLRTLHPVLAFAGDGEAIVKVADEVGWLWSPTDRGGYLLVGTYLGADLLRFRQGDPARAAEGPSDHWGIGGERPLRLFEQQLAGAPAGARFADEWARTLAEAVAFATGAVLPPLLPEAARGAVVVTGDDDQAYLESYEHQLRLLDGLPVTYFLHPETRHDATTLRGLDQRGRTELGLHPDALAEPHRYGELLAEQVAWFTSLTGRRPRLVRNHGYLSDGYWGHLAAWLEHGLVVDANLPGVDGRVLNGSLLPARVAVGDGLTAHWSILTALGDGMIDALGLGDDDAASRVAELGAQIVDSGMPGVLVLNLHPENARRTPKMHAAVHRLVEEGFHAWTLGECIDWFAARDTP